MSKLDIFFVAATTASAGWAVYRKCKVQEPREPGRVRVTLDGDPTNTEISIPKGCIKIQTRDRVSAARCAITLDTADRLYADATAAAKAQRDFTFEQLKNRYHAA